jgi:hypothetical protein
MVMPVRSAAMMEEKCQQFYEAQSPNATVFRLSDTGTTKRK